MSANFLTKEKVLNTLSTYHIESLKTTRDLANACGKFSEITGMHYTFIASAIEPFAEEMIESFKEKFLEDHNINVTFLTFKDLLIQKALRLSPENKRQFLRLMRGDYNELKQHALSMPWIS